MRKALHLARRALEPELPRRGTSSYLLLSGDMLALAADSVWIDAAHFEALARRALAGEESARYQAAIDAYTGELLPEDRYEEWTVSRRDALADLFLRLLLGQGDLLAAQGAYDAAVERLRQVLSQDPTRVGLMREGG